MNETMTKMLSTQGMKKGRKATDRDKEPHKAVWGELGALEERLRKGERTFIPEGLHMDYDVDLREREHQYEDEESRHNDNTITRTLDKKLA